MAIYVTKDGDMLDAICLAFYGRSKNVTEMVLDHNPSLAGLGPVYSVGVEIMLPERPKDLDNNHTISLWS